MVAAILSPWSILPAEEITGGDMARKGVWEAIGGWRSILAAIVGALAMLAFFYYFLNLVLPDLRQGQEKVLAELQKLRGDLQEQEKRQRQDLAAHAVEERQIRENLSSNVRAMRSHVIALKVKVEGKVNASDLKDLVSQVEGVSGAEAVVFTGVTDVIGMPKPYSGFDKFKTVGLPYDALALKAGKLRVDQSLATLLLTRDARWEATAEGLTVFYEGGSAKLRAKPTASKYDLIRQADVFNSLSQAVDALADSVTPKKKLEQIKGSTPPPTPHGTAPNPATRAAPFVDKMK